jgi:spermidine/putrescine transport system ATP-binding protein
MTPSTQALTTRSLAIGDPAIRLTEITKSFGDAVVVKPLTLEIGQNEFFSILGPSGCGKTTLMRMIAGFEIPTAGSIELAGLPVDNVPTRKRDLNMLFQSYALFPHLTVFENVAFELRVRRTAKAEINRRVNETLELVRLGHLGDRKPDKLSGGQRQRVALARAVVGRPAVVLLDEPLGALDQQLRKEMQIELKRLQREVGITFIYVTHDQEEALTMSDRIAVMSQGELLQVGSPQEIYDRPASSFVASFIGSCNVIPAIYHGAAGQVVINGLGAVPADISPETPVGLGVFLAVRPERMTVSAESPGPLSAPGVITDSIYLGGEWRFGIDLQGGGHVSTTVASSQLSPHLATIAPGDKLWLTWRAADARALTS